MATAIVPNYLYKPGEQIPESGMYFAHHVGIHCSWPKAILETNHTFPACPTCGDNVRYVLGRNATRAN
jgi:hypothetical protein